MAAGRLSREIDWLTTDCPTTIILPKTRGAGARPIENLPRANLAAAVNLWLNARRF
jgi:hypothetical protein